MTRQLSTFLFVLIAVASSATEGRQKQPADTAAIRVPTELRQIPQSAFRLGERLVFDVNYSLFTAAEAVFSVNPADSVQGREAWQILFTVQTTRFFSRIFTVEDRYESIIDAGGVFPWRYQQHVREGKYSLDYGASFDQLRHIAKGEGGVFKIPPYTHDVVSAFFFARTLDYSTMRPGQRVEYKNFFRDSTYALGIKFLGYQQIEVDAGTFNCLLVEPLIKEGGLFKSEGRVLIYLSNDERKIPVKVVTKVLIGSINAELREYSGLTGPLPSKVE